MAFFTKELYTVKEAADALRCHTNTVYKMIRSGRLPAYKMRESYRIYGKDLEALRLPDLRPGPKPKQKEDDAMPERITIYQPTPQRDRTHVEIVRPEPKPKERMKYTLVRPDQKEDQT